MDTSSTTKPTPARYRYLRHQWPVRVMHWLNVVAISVLLMSGLQIFNAHPALNWGKSSYNGRPPVLQMYATQSAQGQRIGITEVFGTPFNTTGFLGASKDESGELMARAFPSWLTIPSNQYLAMGRRWHFFFAWLFVINGLMYVAYTLLSRHYSEDLAPTRRDWRSIGRSVLDHLRFRHPIGEAAKHYNILQKLTYLTLIFGILPLTILMGLAMSPRADSVFAGWVDLVGGRQSARCLHFLGAVLIVLFVLVHVFEVIVSGLWNNLRSMVSGAYEIDATPAELPMTTQPDGHAGHGS